MLVLDSGAVSRLAERSQSAAALILALREEGCGLLWFRLWCWSSACRGTPGGMPRRTGCSRPATSLRTWETGWQDGRPSCGGELGEGLSSDALVVAVAEPGGTVLTTRSGRPRSSRGARASSRNRTVSELWPANPLVCSRRARPQLILNQKSFRGTNDQPRTDLVSRA